MEELRILFRADQVLSVLDSEIERQELELKKTEDQENLLFMPTTEVSS
jgi:hypothetical protein